MILNFGLWLLLRENFDPAAYDALFNKEVATIWPTIPPDDRHGLAAMRNGWTNYIAACLRNSGVRDQGDLEEKLHDIVVRLLVSPGGLFKNYDPASHGPLLFRFRRSISNAVKNLAERETNRKRFIRPAPNHTGYEPGPDELPARPETDHDETILDGFRTFLQTELGDLAVWVFNARMEGREMADLVLPNLDRPSRYRVKQAVQQIKIAARKYAHQLNDPSFLRRVDDLFRAEAATVARRLSTTQQRRAGAARL